MPKVVVIGQDTVLQAGGTRSRRRVRSPAPAMRPDPRVEPDDDGVLEAENCAPDGADAPRTREAP